MKFIAALGFFVCLCFANTAALDVDSILEKVKAILVNLDPLSLSDVETTLLNLVDLKIGSLEADGFSNIQVESLSVDEDAATATGVLSLDVLSASVSDLVASISALGLNIEITKLEAQVGGIAVDGSIGYAVNGNTYTLTSVDGVATVELISLEVDAAIGDTKIELSVSSAEKVNLWLDENKDTVLELILVAVNLILERIEL